jgi:nitrogen fixation protein NifU and related proteins
MMTETLGDKVDTRINLASLYQEVIVDHSKRPRFKGKPANGCQICQDGKNPLCGDDITLFCEVKKHTDGWQISTKFEGKGCTISQASASMMCDKVQNMLVRDAKLAIERAEDIYTGKARLASKSGKENFQSGERNGVREAVIDDADDEIEDDLEEDVDALAGVAKFPVRVKCAALAWKTLELVLKEHFDSNGNYLGNPNGCFLDASCAREGKKLKVVSVD